MIRSIFTNFSVRLAVAVINFVMLLLTTHYLGKDIRGEIATIQLGINIIHMVSELTGGPSLIYLVPRTRLPLLLFAGTAWSFISTAGIGAVLIAFDLIPGKYTVEVLIFALLISLHSVNQSTLLGQQRIRLFNFLHLSQGIIQLATMIVCLFVFDLKEAWPFLYASITGYGIIYFAGLILVNRNPPPPHIAEEKPRIWLLFRNGFFTQAASLVFMISLRENYYVLKNLTPDENYGAVGIYSTALSLGEALLLFSTSVAAVTLSRVANTESYATIRATVMRLSKLTIVVTALAAIFFALLPDTFYAWLLGKDFHTVGNVFNAIAPGIVLISFGTIYGHYFSGTGKHYMNFISGLCALIAAFLFSAPLIARYNVIGAGWAATIAYTTTALVIFLLFMLSGKRGEWKLLLPSSEDFLFISNFLRRSPVK
ncbi:MAG TPA: polysaccharide biosynthesis C-terminal domain-containing protein [Bacteroidia bacterium]|nr:polysaccharide biosynthesis C-terminal domain-containing protein [Bacteroidia bacterium]